MLHGMTFASALILAAGPGGVSLAGLQEWASSAWSVLLLLCGFSLVIFVHELGHFLAAKWAGVRVDRFAIGFGKELLGFTKGETRYSLNALPLGGYVKMLGQEDFVIDKSGELKVKDNPDSFTNKPIGRRMVIISAGVIMNLLFAAIAFAIVVMVGQRQPPAVVGAVLPNSPASNAGIQTGDRIAAINGDRIDSFSDLMQGVVLSDPDEPLMLDVMRNGKLVEPRPVVLPEYKKDVRLRQIGIAPGQNLRVRLPSPCPDQPLLPDELHSKDDLSKLVENGQAREYKDLGAFSRAIAAARGSPVDIVVQRPDDPDALTDEMALTASAEVKSSEVHVQCRAVWIPVPYDPEETVAGSLLGLVPRLTVFYPEPGKTFEQAGVKQGDVITSMGAVAYPSYAEIKKLIEENPGRPLALEVRRTRAANHGLEPFTVEFCVRHREALIASARNDLAKALAAFDELAKAPPLPPSEREKLRAELEKLPDAKSWRVWLENVDAHKLDPLAPKAPFALFSKTLPTIDAVLRCIDEDHLVVGDIQDKLGDADSPAKLSGIPRGAVIVAVDGELVTRWSELSEKFRAKAGQAVTLSYRLVDEVRATKMSIPPCISTAMNLPPGARVVAIDGKDSSPVKSSDGKINSISLPDWRAIRGLLSDSVNKTVKVEYVTSDGDRHTGEYTVAEDGVDPWLHRVLYAESFDCYPLVERHPVHNPILAAGIGFKKAYRTTMQTIQTIRHLIVTRQVGFNKISGPVGIIRLGTQFADSGVINLLFFLAVLSANLAVINFLPMPIVDGGLFLFLLLEKIRGEPVSIKTQVATQIVGIALIGAVFVLVTYQDIRNWILGT